MSVRDLLGLSLLVLGGVSSAPAQSQSRKENRNDVGIELLGKAAIYSFQYQRLLTSSVGLEAGLGVIGSGGGGENATVIFVPVGARFYLIPKDGSLFLTGGAVWVSGILDSGPFSENASDAYGYGGLGFEYRAQGGFLFRGTAYVLFGSGGYFIWPGITAGFAF